MQSIGFVVASSTALALAAGLASSAEVPTQLPRTARPTHYELAITPHAESLTLDGTAVITIDVLEPTPSLTLNAVDLTFRSARLTSVTDGHARPATVGVNPSNQTATFTFTR